MAARSGTCKMPKKPSKTGPRAASKASSRRLPMAATKRPPASAEDGTTERIARAPEAIAAQLSAASPPPAAADSFGGADDFVWPSNGPLSPVPHVSPGHLGLLKEI